MKKIGITGANGFLGYHLCQYLKLQERVEVIPYEDDLFDAVLLRSFVKKCAVIVHLAALNRHENPEVIYESNLTMVKALISACEFTKVNPHILLSSSTQEEQDNPYGRSKREGRVLLERWANENNAIVTGMIIPNVFGAFCKPNYNSFIATFCHKIAYGETPSILNDSTVKLIYVQDLVKDIYQLILEKKGGKINVGHSYQLKVSDVLGKLENFRELYIDHHSFPDISEPFDLALFNTFLTYLPETYFPRYLKKNIDNRGMFVEVTRTNSQGQFSYSTTVPGITRGNHFHTRKAERFTVIKGKAKIELRKIGTSTIQTYYLNGDEPAYVDMPIWHSHNITNVGDQELITLFWINEPYDADDPDTYFVGV